MSFSTLTLSKDNLDALVPLIKRYEDSINDAEPIFQIDGQKLELLMRNNPHHRMRYDQQAKELKALLEWLKTHQDAVQGKLWKKYVEGYPRALSTRDIQSYISNEKEYLEFSLILIEVELLKTKMDSIVEAIDQLHWSLGNVTKLRVAEMQDAIL